MKWEDDKYCFACGVNNPHGLKLQFEIIEGQKAIKTEIALEKKFQGYADIVHGGIISLILDEVMVNAPLKLYNNTFVSGEISVRFKKPARVNQKLIFIGKIVNEVKNIIYTEGTASLEDGTIIATATAKCFMLKE